MSIRKLRSRLILFSCVLLLLVIDLGLRLTSYRRMCRWLLTLSPSPDPTVANREKAVVMARVVNRAAVVFSASCLRRSLLVWWLLRWQRIPSDIQVGFSRESGHAWVEHHGYVINDRQDIATGYQITYDTDFTPERIAQIR